MGDAIPLPVDQLKGVFAAVRGSMGANVPQAAEVCPAPPALLVVATTPCGAGA